VLENTGYQPQREISGMPAGRTAKRIAKLALGAAVIGELVGTAEAGKGTVSCAVGTVGLVGGVITGAAFGIRALVNRGKNADVKLNEMIKDNGGLKNNDAYPDLIETNQDVLPSHLSDNPFLTSMVAVFNAEPSRMNQYYAEDGDGHLTANLKDVGSPEKEGPVVVDQKSLKQLIKDSGEKLSILRKDGYNGILAVRGLETAMAQRLGREGGTKEGFGKLEKLDAASSLLALTGKEVDSFTLEKCTPEPDKQCQEEAYAKIAAALNRNDPVVFTKASGENYAVNDLHPAGFSYGQYDESRKEPALEVQLLREYSGDDHRPVAVDPRARQVLSGISARYECPNPSTMVVSPFETGNTWCEDQPLNQAGATVAIGSLDTIPRASPVAVMPQVTPSPTPSPNSAPSRAEPLFG
jgi:hypothetical protein